VVARRTGLSADVLRAWEKRYGMLKPARASGGRRLYSDADIEYLRLLRRATAAAPRNGIILLAFADAAADAGAPEVAAPLRARAAALLPHEIVVGFGPRPQRASP